MKRFSLNHCGSTLITYHLSLIISIVLLSCTTDAYDKGDGEYSLMQAEMADVHIDEKGHADYFVTDADERLTVDNTFSSSWMTKNDTTYRAVVYFSRTTAKEGETGVAAEIVSASRVGLIIPKRLKKAENMKDDPVRFESVWVSSSYRYLNIGLYLMCGSTDDKDAVHVLGCVADTLIDHENSTSTAYATLYHDQGGQPEYYSQRTYVSIPLDSIPADSLHLTINTYDGPVVKTVKIKEFSTCRSRGVRSCGGKVE